MSYFTNLMTIGAQRFPVNHITGDNFNRADGNITATANNFPTTGAWKWGTATSGRISGKYYYPSTTVGTWSTLLATRSFTNKRVRILVNNYQSGGVPNLRLYMGVSTPGVPGGASNSDGLVIFFNNNGSYYNVYSIQYNGTTVAQNSGNFISTIPYSNTVNLDVILYGNNLKVYIAGTNVMDYTFPTSFTLQGSKNGAGFYYISGGNPYYDELIVMEA